MRKKTKRQSMPAWAKCQEGIERSFLSPCVFVCASECELHQLSRVTDATAPPSCSHIYSGDCVCACILRCSLFSVAHIEHRHSML